MARIGCFTLTGAVRCTVRDIHAVQVTFTVCEGYRRSVRVPVTNRVSYTMRVLHRHSAGGWNQCNLRRIFNEFENALMHPVI